MDRFLLPGGGFRSAADGPPAHFPSMTPFAAGFALGLSLILAIGAQNAFVLRQGLRGEHALAVCLACALSDAVLISCGSRRFRCRSSARAVDGRPDVVGRRRVPGELQRAVVWGSMARRRVARGG